MSSSETRGPATEGRVLHKAAPVYDALNALFTLGGHGRLCVAAARHLAPRAGERILDVGCGTGLLTEEVSRYAHGQCNIVGIDAASSMIRVARKKRALPGCSYEVALAEDLPFEDESFDAACSTMFFHHINATLKYAALLELLRVLRPGGRLVIADMGRPYSFFGSVISHGAAFAFRQPEIAENTRGVLPESIRQCGFNPVREIDRRSGFVIFYSTTKPLTQRSQTDEGVHEPI